MCDRSTDRERLSSQLARSDLHFVALIDREASLSNEVHCKSWFHTLSIDRKRVYMKLHVPRMFRRVCKTVQQIPIGFADTRLTYTAAFARYAMELGNHIMTIKMPPPILASSGMWSKRSWGANWSGAILVSDSGDLNWLPSTKYPLANSSGIWPWCLISPLGCGLRWRWQRCWCAAAIPGTIATLSAYISAVSKNLPKATIVFVHFHLIKMYNDKLSTLRRDLQNRASKNGKKVLKGTR